MASGFKSLQKKTKSFKALSIASATLLTEKIGEVFSEVEDSRESILIFFAQLAQAQAKDFKV